ncbi:hypothetical protein CA234_09525 [Sphingomonas sp. ABOLE]|uniref:hypothetical protein n=1 Tax=Sphingomonas sp. ABOLE TaxID=1985878 RepID=UPI000F7EE592|nr:hypothetical protein [Sphingomonas sp. ABOLE]RSV41504.1 hypothetical protein CA234_09525 [Sphingomonas sp. ABOLE]
MPVHERGAEEGAPISLYLDLAPGRVADLSVVAYAALAWDALIKEIASVVDPSLDVRVELVSGEDGSLWLRSLIKAISKVSKEHPWTAGALSAIVSTFLMFPVNHTVEDMWKEIFKAAGHEDGISDEDAKKIADHVTANLRNQVAVSHKQRIFREVERDPSIIGLGSAPNIHRKPKTLIPRSQFFLLSGEHAAEVESFERREIWKHDYNVVLVRPVLVADPRRWRFQHGGVEFSATMNDRVFLNAIGERHTGLELGEGIEMRVDLRVKQERHAGAWVDKEQFVERVIYPTPAITSGLHFPSD